MFGLFKKKKTEREELIRHLKSLNDIFKTDDKAQLWDLAVDLHIKRMTTKELRSTAKFWVKQIRKGLVENETTQLALQMKIDELRTRMNPFKENPQGWSFGAWNEGFDNYLLQNPYMGYTQLTECWDAGAKARRQVDELRDLAGK